MLSHGIIHRICIAITLVIISLFAVSAVYGARAGGDRGKNSSNKQNAKAAEIKASGRNAPSAKGSNPRGETARQTPTTKQSVPRGTVRPTPGVKPGNTKQATPPAKPKAIAVSSNNQRDNSATQRNNANRQREEQARSNNQRNNQDNRDKQKDSRDKAQPSSKTYHPVLWGDVYQRPQVKPAPKQQNSRDNRKNSRDKAQPSPKTYHPVLWGDVYQRPQAKPAPKPGLVSYQPKNHRPPTHRNGFFYYPTHFVNKPMRFGFWYFGNYDPGFCRKSVYFYFGYFPYVEAARVWIGPYVSVTYVSRPVIHDSGYYLSQSKGVYLEYAMADIRNAWMNGRPDLIQNHVRAGDKIAVLLDGKYDYSLDSDDYLQMTTDAVDQIKTINFTWTTTRERTDGRYTAFGKHQYRDSAGAVKTIYLSYTLETVGSACYITEVGYSGSPLI